MLLCGSGQIMGMAMSDMRAERMAAGVSFLFDPGERPDGAAWRRAIEGCQARVRTGHEDAAAGLAEMVLDGLSFDVAGLAPASAWKEGALEAVRLYPGAHLSGGLRLAPVVRALATLAAELAVALPVRQVLWHPADVKREPRRFSHAVLAWLAGGVFPARELSVLTLLSDGSVTSRGLAHFTGQELRLQGGASRGDAALRLAERTIDHLVRHGPVTTIQDVTIDRETLWLEPAQRGEQVWVWRKEAVV